MRTREPRRQRLHHFSVNLKRLLDVCVLVRGREIVRRQKQDTAFDGLLLEEAFHKRAVIAIVIEKFNQRPSRMRHGLQAMRKSGLLGECIKSILQSASVGFHFGQSIGRLQNVEHLHGGSHGSNFSGKSETEKDFLEAAHHVCSSHNAGNGEPVPHGLSKASKIGSDTKSLLRAAQTEMEAATNFIEDQQSAIPMRQVLNAL